MKHLLSNFRYHLGLHLISGLVMTAGLVLIVGILTFSQNLRTILTVWGESLQMNAYLTEEATSEDIALIDKVLKNNDRVGKVSLIDQHQALENFRKQMAAFAPELSADRELMSAIPASFQISLSDLVPAEKHISEMASLAQQVQALKGIEQVSYGQEWVKSYAAMLSGIDWVGVIFISVIFIGALFVTSNVIRSSINQRREEIELFELLGASKNFIRTPYITEGAILGFVSSALAVVFSYGLFQSALASMSAELSLLQMANLLHFLTWPKLLILVLGSTGFSALAAFLCLKNLNTGWSASQRLRKT